MPMTSKEKSKRHSQKKRSEGKRPLQVWVPVAVFEECIDLIGHRVCSYEQALSDQRLLEQPRPASDTD